MFQIKLVVNSIFSIACLNSSNATYYDSFWPINISNCIDITVAMSQGGVNLNGLLPTPVSIKHREISTKAAQNGNNEKMIV